MARSFATGLLRRGWLGLLLGLAGCIDPYLPDVGSSSGTLLVVDGFINGNGRSTFLLSRSAGVNTSSNAPGFTTEKGASVSLLDSQGQPFTLRETEAGTYVSDSLVLDPSRQYHLRIVTATTKAAYESDPVPLKVTPPIDQVHYRRVGDQVQVLLDAHDATGQSRFFRWALTETWQFNSAYESALQYRHGRLENRTTPIYTCWRTEQSHLIRQGSTNQLAVPVLTDVLLTEPSGHDERFKVRYSVLVSQMAETAEEFAYWEILRKNTEAVGTVNDPLPSQLTGNVHRLDKPGEAVLGFVGAHTVQQQRLFISPQELDFPNSWEFSTPYTSCSAGIELFYDPITKGQILSWPHTRTFVDTLSQVPIDVEIAQGDTAGYLGSSYQCVDCRARGTNTKPSFW